MSKTYLVTLTPTHTFFFGDETKFRTKWSKTEKETKADYFQRSAMFPQQTTLLGTLRYFILQQNNLLSQKGREFTTKEKGDIQKLIGNSGFSLGHKNGYGLIKKISPVFILKENKRYFLNPKDLKQNKVYPKYLELIKAPYLSSSYTNSQFFLKDFDEKEGLDTFLIDYSDTQNTSFLTLTKDNDSKHVFNEHQKVGIDKQKPDEAFYKQTSYSLEPGCNFAFYVNLNEPINNSKENITGFVSMGAEQSVFKIELKEEADNLSPLNEVKIPETIEDNECYKLTLLSDTYLSDYRSLISDSVLTISGIQAFRFFSIASGKEKKSYSSFKRSSKINLLTKGSVFFFDNKVHLENLCAEIKKHPEFRTIGYNHYRITKTKTNKLK